MTNQLDKFVPPSKVIAAEGEHNTMFVMMAVMVVMDMDLMVVIIMDKVLMNLLSKVISAEGEHKASRALKHAADVLMDNSGAMQVLIVMNLLICNQISLSTFYIHFFKNLTLTME